jgi:hypothetical protein
MGDGLRSTARKMAIATYRPPVLPGMPTCDYGQEVTVLRMVDDDTIEILLR